MEAWLITWEWMGDAAATEDQFVNVLPADTPLEEVVRIVGILYRQFTSTPGEMVESISAGGHDPYRAKTDETAPGYTRVICGSHPWLEARLVRSLGVRGGGGHPETIAWQERMSSGAWDDEQITRTRSGALSFRPVS